jgi:hypothetical protein
VWAEEQRVVPRRGVCGASRLLPLPGLQVAGSSPAERTGRPDAQRRNERYSTAAGIADLREIVVTTPFKGTINVDIRDSEPDWSPFEPPKAPSGAPNVVYIVLDDVGFSAMSCYGGPIETPNIDRIAAEGVRYTQWHTTALCSPTRSCLLTGRNHTRNSMACITEGAVGFPNVSGTIPPENGMLSEILGELGWNTYMVGRFEKSSPAGRGHGRVSGSARASGPAPPSRSSRRRPPR